MSKDRCPVCGYSLGFAPWKGESASDEICPGCGIQFGYNDARPDLREGVYAEWRRQWIAGGRRAFAGAEWRRIAALVASKAKEQVAKD